MESCMHYCITLPHRLGVSGTTRGIQEVCSDQFWKLDKGHRNYTGSGNNNLYVNALVYSHFAVRQINIMNWHMRR